MCVKVLILILCLVGLSLASVGDRSPIYRRCIHACLRKNCSISSGMPPDPGFFWDCSDDCGYNCMWITTRVYMKEGYPVPQFYGKWPFTKLWYIQEPLSVLFSILNFAFHLVMFLKFRSLVPSKAPYHRLWTVNALVCLNGWFWSTIFHSRDVSWTEKLDYFSAFAMVLFSCYCLCIRILDDKSNRDKIILSVCFVAFFLYHIGYLSVYKFDYGYNMKANIAVGVANGIGWLFWCYGYWDRPYSRWCLWSIVLLGLGLLLEVLDFPPLWWAVDAHALWHLSTVPFPLLWYRFIIEDCLYLHRQNKLKKDT